MSSPRRAAKAVAAKGVKKVPRQRRPVAARPRAKSKVGAVDGASTEAKRLAGVLERSIVDGNPDIVAADALQTLIGAACRVYSARIAAGEQFTPVGKNSISATDVMVTASGLLKAADLAVFELGMWQSWTGR